MDPRHLLRLHGTLRTRTASGTDTHGNPTWTVTDSDVRLWCELTSADEEGTRDVGTWRVFLPAGTDLTSVDAISVPGVAGELEPVGEPWQVRHPDGRVLFVTCQARAVT